MDCSIGIKILQKTVHYRDNLTSLQSVSSIKEIRTYTFDASTNRDGDENIQQLRLMMLACEDKPPYGPEDHTARMSLLLICKAITKSWKEMQNAPTNINSTEHTYAKDENKYSDSKSCNNAIRTGVTVSISIYKVKKNNKYSYPKSQEEWDSYDGVLIPGSISDAYSEDEEWIQMLKRVIQTEIHIKRRKVLGICFGHQIYAHSFSEDGGCAVKCPSGKQVGGIVCPTTLAGEALLLRRRQSMNINTNTISKNNSSFTLLYTHGDMVNSLPSCAINLGGTEKVPIQAAAYFSSKEEKDLFLSQFSNKKEYPISELSSYSSLPCLPHAITLQAHPEFAYSSPIPSFSSPPTKKKKNASTDDDDSHDYLYYLGEKGTFVKTVKAILKTDDKTIVDEVRMDALRQLDTIEEDSVDVMVSIGRIFGWYE